LAYVGKFVEAVSQGCVRFGRFDRYIVSKMSSGSGSKGDDRLVDILDSKPGCPAVIDNHDLPKAILGIAPPSQDGIAIKGDFATCFVKKYLAAHIAQDGNGEEIVDKAGESLS
jgi:hypothetical protein